MTEIVPSLTPLEPIDDRPASTDLAVVIPTLGRELLEACLATIARGSRWPAELIVVDQGSNDRVAAWLATLASAGMCVRHLRAPRRGRAAAVNRGLEAVQVRFAAVTDDDCFVAADWIETMTSALRTNPEAIVTGRVEAFGDESVVAVVTSREHAAYRRPRLTHDAMSGGNMGVARTVLDRIGLFDEDPCLASAEDCEYAYRALRRGVPIIYTPDVMLWHVGWRDGSERSIRYDTYGRSLGGFYGKYVRRGDWFIALRTCISLARASRRWMRGIVTRNEELARNGRGYVTGLLPGFLAGWRSSRDRPTPNATQAVSQSRNDARNG
jgi:GT2 family glycosyltransferase